MINNIVIVGGGFAGWLTACVMQYKCPSLKITLIESPLVPRLGVGETLGFESPYVWRDLLGMETDHHLMRHTGSIYKYGITNFDFMNDNEVVYNGQLQNIKIGALTKFFPDFEYVDFYEHWNQKPGDVGVSATWLYMNRDKLNKPGGKTIHDYVLEVQDSTYFLENPVVPYDEWNNKTLRGFNGTSYHIDAEEMVSLLKWLAYSRNSDGRLTHLTDTVVDVRLTEQGEIKEIVKKTDGRAITGDIFIDCSGLGRVLAKHVENDTWQDRSEYSNNSAWVCPSKYTDPHKELICGTRIYGEDYGWRFQLPLYHRMGNGYIFNRDWVDPEVPKRRLEEITRDTALAEPRLIKWDPGFYLHSWKKNLILLGISSGLSDPWDAPTFSEHVKGLEDFIHVYNQMSLKDLDINEARSYYNTNRARYSSERDLRVRIHHGFGNRRGLYWDKRRDAANKYGLLKDFEEIMLEQKTDMNLRLRNYWQHMYAKLAIQVDVDMSKWEFKVPTNDELEMAEAYFSYTRARNKFIRTRKWPNAYEWLKENRFDGATYDEVYQEIQGRK